MATYFADTNLLLRLSDPASPQHSVSTQALASLLAQGDEVLVTPLQRAQRSGCPKGAPDRC